jgi:hypothetical protein
MRAVVGRSGALIHIFTCVPILHQLVTLWTAALIGPFSVGTTVATPIIPSTALINVCTLTIIFLQFKPIPTVAVVGSKGVVAEMRAVVGRSGALIHISTRHPVCHIQLKSLRTATHKPSNCVDTCERAIVTASRALINICACCPIHLQLIATEALTLEGPIAVDTSLTAPLTNSNALVDVFTGSAILSWCVSISTGAVEPSLSVGAQLRAVM